MSKSHGTTKQPQAEGDVPKRRPGRPRLLEPSSDFIARREEILGAAVRVFQEKGYDAGTLDDVADVLDLRRASLYYYVHSKANLLYMIFEQAIQLAVAEMEEIQEIEDPTERLAALIRQQVRWSTSEPGIYTVFFDYRRRLEPQYEKNIAAWEAKHFGILQEAVIGAQAAGTINVADPEYAARAILGLSCWTYKWFQPERDDPDRLVDTCLSIVFKPARTRRSAATTKTPQSSPKAKARRLA